MLANVTLEIQGKFRDRKDGTTQNILAAISFNLKFINILAGGKGITHYFHVLTDALSMPGGLKISEDISSRNFKIIIYVSNILYILYLVKLFIIFNL